MLEEISEDINLLEIGEKKMDTKLNQKLRHILILLAVLGLLIPMFSCSEKKPRVKRSDASGDETVVEEPSKDVVVVQNNSTQNNPTNGSTTGTSPKSNTSSPTTKASANVFEGTWDVDVNGTFGNWNFSYASKNVDKLEGKITDGSSSIIGNYTVFPNKTVEINVGSTSLIVPYKISNGGNQIEVSDGTTKVILTKGKTNTTIQNDGNILAAKIWRNINNPSEQIEFLSVRKSSSGWNGTITLIGGSASTSGTFSLTPGKLTTTIAGSVDTYSYKLRNNNSTLDLTDSSGNTETYN